MRALGDSPGHRAIDEIVPWSERHGWPLSSELADRLALYLDTLIDWNRAFALVSRQDAATLAIKHFADSLAAAAHCRQAQSVVDLGSGAGFPGLVIAIANPQTRVILIESIGKKVSFLREVIRVVRIENAEAVHERIEAVGRKLPNQVPFDTAIARAFGTLEDFLILARPLLREGGTAVAMKGPSHREELGVPPRERAGYAFECAQEYVLPDSSRRSLLRFRRT